MNNEEKNVMTIVTIARIVESSLWYCLPPRNGSFSADERGARYKALSALTGEGSPFSLNCDNNGETGKQLKENMQYFIEDVYGPNGRMVTVGIDNVVRVESSLILELFDSIVKLRGYLESFLHAAIAELRKRNALSDQFENLINTDIRYFHAFAGKVSCVLISNKFMEINQMARTLTENYSKTHNGMNPQNDPEFNIENDPSFRMLENEFHQINSNMNAVLNTYGTEDAPDEEFRFARQNVYSDCDLFSGKKQTTDINAFFNVFTSYFDKILEKTQNTLNQMFIDVGKEMRVSQPNEASAPSATPVSTEETK
jgi:hypothetical protein